MVYARIGPATTSSSGSVSVSVGAGTTAGALLVAISSVRSGTATVDAFGDNSGTNVWTPLPTSGGGDFALQTFVWYCSGADPFNQADVAYSEGVAANLVVYEFPDHASIDDYSVATEPGAAQYPSCQVTPTSATATVLGALSIRSNRGIGQINLDYTDDSDAASGQLYSWYAIRENAGTDPTGPQYETTSGTPTTGALLTIAVTEGGAPVDPSEGTISGAVSWTGTVTGSAPDVGTSSGSIVGAVTWTGTATGQHSPIGTIAGGTGWAGTITGKRVAIGGASGQIVWDGTGVGHREPVGTIAGGIGWTGAATGQAPDVDTAAGTIAGTVAWAGSTTGQRHPKASMSGAVQWAGTATGERQPQGSIAGTLAWTGAAVGATHRHGTITGAIAWTGTAVGRGAGLRDITVTLGQIHPARTIRLSAPRPARTLTLGPPRS